VIAGHGATHRRSALDEQATYFERLLKLVSRERARGRSREDISKLPNITIELMKRGYSAADMHKILGGNIMRVFKEVEKMRDQIKAEGEQAPLLPKKDAAKQ